MEISWKKYLYAFFITMVIFVTAILLSNYLNSKKIGEIKLSEDKIATDILSAETRFALLGEYPCREMEDSDLSSELDDVGEKLNYGEENFSGDREELNNLKKLYSLLEIKNYLLLKKLNNKCAYRPFTILYFYSNNNCDNCAKQGYVLTYLRQKYPKIRIYSFDYNLDLSVLKTLINIFAVKDNLPALVIGEKLYNGFKGVEGIESLLPKSVKDTATSTPILNI